MHTQRAAVDRNSIIVVFLLYRCLKRRHNGLHLFNPIIKNREEFGAFYTLFNEHTVKPWFTNASYHEQFGLRTNFPNTKRLG